MDQKKKKGAAVSETNERNQKGSVDNYGGIIYAFKNKITAFRKFLFNQSFDQHYAVLLLKKLCIFARKQMTHELIIN